jgi:peptidoglycan/xylan/chitin deacetylase (PgdA/CDA1 family)
LLTLFRFPRRHAFATAQQVSGNLLTGRSHVATEAHPCYDETGVLRRHCRKRPYGNADGVMYGNLCWRVARRSSLALLLAGSAGLTMPGLNAPASAAPALATPALATPALAAPASAAECPGHPDALGISRVLVVDPREHPRIGAMQYKETLPLHDHEVVLTFDDGPVPKYSNQVLQILADQCLKAVFFTIGIQAQSSPAGVRKLAADGQTIGTHSQNHPLTFNRMSLEQAKPEVDQGIASVTTALGDNASALSPFFRVPGLLRAEAVEGYVGSLGVQMWSADFLADDWRKISAAKVYELAIKRIEARGRGVLLLHDIHQRTVQALPNILRYLKEHNYHIVQVVVATAERPATPTDPQDWLVHRPSDNVPVAQWPAVPSFDFARAITQQGLTPADADLLSAGPAFTPASPQQTPWPHVAGPMRSDTAALLPVPAATLFEIPDPMPTAPSHRRVARADVTPQKTRSAAVMPRKPAAHARHEAAPAERAKRSSRANLYEKRLDENPLDENRVDSNRVDENADLRVASLRKR